MERPLDKRRKVTWRIAGKLMDPPDSEGEVYWIVEIHTTGNFKGYRNPIVQFIAGTKLGDIVDPFDPEPPALPIYRYTVEVTFRSSSSLKRNTNFQVVRVFDGQGRPCDFKRDGRQPYYLAPWLEEAWDWNIQEGIWRTLITGKVKRDLANMEEIWRNMAPYLLQMSSAPEMRKMEELYLGEYVPHEKLHTDTGDYGEGVSLAALMAKDAKTLKEALTRPLLRMPPPKVISKDRIVEHHEIHRDTSEYEDEG